MEQLIIPLRIIRELASDEIFSLRIERGADRRFVRSAGGEIDRTHHLNDAFEQRDQLAWFSSLINDESLLTHLNDVNEYLNIVTIFTLVRFYWENLHDKNSFSTQLCLSSTNFSLRSRSIRVLQARIMLHAREIRFLSHCLVAWGWINTNRTPIPYMTKGRDLYKCIQCRQARWISLRARASHTSFKGEGMYVRRSRS